MTTFRAAAFVDQLDVDWKHTTISGHARRTLRAWRTHGEHGPLFAGFSTLDDIIMTLHASVPAESDPLLSALIGFAHNGDQVAGRLVLQAFAGLAIQVSTRSRGCDNDHVGDVFGVLAEQIAIFPLDTHPTNVARHLSFMVRRRLNRRHRRATLDTVSFDWTDDTDPDGHVTGDSWLADTTDSRTAADRVAGVVTAAHAGGGLDDDQARLLLFVAAGHQVASLARKAGCHRSRMGARVAKATIAASAFAVAA